MSTHANMVKMTTATTGTGTITLGSASSGFQSFYAGYDATAATVDILIVDGTDWEVARDCTYNGANPGTVTRGTFEDSSTGSALNLSGSAVVSVTSTAALGNSIENFLGAWGALSGENSITAAATAVIGRLNVCSGTSADYTVTLPAASGNAGKYIGFSMAPALTRFVSLDAGAESNINGASTTLSAAVTTTGATSISVTSASSFPTAGRYLVLIGSEQMLVTGGQGTTTWTVVRGCAGTTAATHSSADPVDWNRTRTMWRGESALLRCDGTTWQKQAGLSIPMLCVVAPSSDEDLSTDPAITLTTVIEDSTGRMADIANNRVLINRSGLWSFTPVGRIRSAAANRARFYAGVWVTRNSVETSWVVLGENSLLSGSVGYATVRVPVFSIVGDTLKFRMGGVVDDSYASGTTEGSFLAVEENVSW